MEHVVSRGDGDSMHDHCPCFAIHVALRMSHEHSILEDLGCMGVGGAQRENEVSMACLGPSQQGAVSPVRTPLLFGPKLF